MPSSLPTVRVRLTRELIRAHLGDVVHGSRCPVHAAVAAALPGRDFYVSTSRLAFYDRGADVGLVPVPPAVTGWQFRAFGDESADELPEIEWDQEYLP